MGSPLSSIPVKLMGALALVTALLGIACASILLVFAEKEISPYAATFDRLSIATIIFLLWHSSTQILSIQIKEPPKIEFPPLKGLFLPSAAPQLVDVGLLLISGIAFSGSLSLWAWSLTQTSVANSTLLNNMMPIFTTIGAWIFLRESFSSKFLLGMGIAIVGAILIGLEDLQITNGFLGDEAALGAALLSAINILCVEQLRTRLDTSWIMLWSSFVGSLFVMLLLLVMQEPFFPRTMIGWTSVIALAVLSQALGQGLLTYSLKTFSAGFVAISMLSIPVIAAMLAILFFDERLSPLNWFAFGIVLSGIYISMSSRPSSRPSSQPSETKQLNLAEIPVDKAINKSNNFLRK